MRRGTTIVNAQLLIVLVVAAALQLGLSANR